MGRPKKYKNQQQRIAAIKQTQKKLKRISGKYFRLIIPSLQSYGINWKYNDKAIKDLKASTLDLLHLKEKPRGLDKYIVSIERHPGTKYVHLDILLIYNKTVFNTYNRYDYLIKHGNLTKYRTLNKAILEYNLKEDPSPLGNLNPTTALMESRVKTELYTMMEEAMLLKPFKFDPIDWLSDTKLMASAMKTNVFKTIRMIKLKQSKVCNQQLKNKPGIKFITPEYIKSTLSPSEYQLFTSWSGYQTIIDHINQIPTYGYLRPHKTKNLFLTGPPNTGKSTLVIELEKHCASYPLGTKHGWFPHFQSHVYTLLSWDEFHLKCYPYPDLLKLLEGRPMKLPQKGGHIERADNQLIICTSNLTIHEHVCNRFKSPSNRIHSLANLGVRFTEIIIPEDKPLFLLIKLIKPTTI